MKKILSIMTVGFLMMSMMGFTSNQKDFFMESQKVSKWEGAEMKGTLTMSFRTYGEPNQTISMDYSSLTNNKNLKVETTFSNLKLPSKNVYPPLKMYFDKDTIYYDLNTAVVAAGEFMKEDVNKYVEVKDSYLGYTVDVEKLMTMSMYKDFSNYNSLIKLSNNPQALLESYDKFIASDPEMDMEIKKDGSTYSIDSDLYEFAKIGKVFLKELNLMNAEELADFDKELEESKEELKKVNVKYTVEFQEDSYKGDLFIASTADSMIVPVFSLGLNFTATKKDNPLIQMPSSYIKFNLNEIIKKTEEEMAGIGIAENEMETGTEEAIQEVYEEEKPFLVIHLDGSYEKGQEKGKLEYKNIYGNLYLKKADIEKILGLNLENAHEYVRVNAIDDTYEYYTLWNNENNTVEVYKY